MWWWSLYGRRHISTRRKVHVVCIDMSILSHVIFAANLVHSREQVFLNCSEEQRQSTCQPLVCMFPDLDMVSLLALDEFVVLGFRGWFKPCDDFKGSLQDAFGMQTACVGINWLLNVCFSVIQI